MLEKRYGRQQLIFEINECAKVTPAWAEQIRSLVEGYENDTISFDELKELTEDYKRQIQNDSSITEEVNRARLEQALAILVMIAKAAI